MSKDLFTGLPDELQDLLSDVEKTSSQIEIKVERRKYGKLWAVVSGIDLDTPELKDLVKNIKNKLACAGTIKGKNIEILYGRHDRTKDLVKVLEEQGFQKDSISVTSSV